MIKSTKDYSIFKKCEFNRALDPKNVAKIRDSINSRNLLNMRPILVNEDMEIIDGQHRLEVAKQLQLEIYYQIDKTSKIEDIILLNANQKNWIIQDYLNYFSKQGLEPYLKFERYMKDHKIKMNVALSLFGVRGGGDLDKFRRGRFEFPENLDETNKLLFYFKNMSSFVQKRYVGNKSFLEASNFGRTFFNFFSRKDISFEKFMEKLEIKMEWLRRASSLGAYLDIFKSIYNYKNLSPID